MNYIEQFREVLRHAIAPMTAQEVAFVAQMDVSRADWAAQSLALKGDIRADLRRRPARWELTDQGREAAIPPGASLEITEVEDHDTIPPAVQEDLDKNQVVTPPGAVKIGPPLNPPKTPARSPWEAQSNDPADVVGDHEEIALADVLVRLEANLKNEIAAHRSAKVPAKKARAKRAVPVIDLPENTRIEVVDDGNPNWEAPVHLMGVPMGSIRHKVRLLYSMAHFQCLDNRKILHLIAEDYGRLLGDTQMQAVKDDLKRMGYHV